MPYHNHNENFNPSVRSISLIASLSAIYVICTLIPISPFIGGPSILTLNLIIVPLIALLLNPVEALFAAIIGSLVSMWMIPTALANIFGPSAVLLPTLGAFMGSFSKYRYGKLIVGVYLAFCIMAFTTAIPEFPFWVAPHALALILCLTAEFIENEKIKTIIIAYVSTMCEQAIMMNLAVYQVQLPWQVFAVAFPFMIYERVLAAFGGFILYIALKKAPILSDLIKSS